MPTLYSDTMTKSLTTDKRTLHDQYRELAMRMESDPDDAYRTRSMLWCILILLLLCCSLLLPFITYQVPPPQAEAVLVSFGMPDLGQTSETPAPSAQQWEETVEETQQSAAEQPPTPSQVQKVIVDQEEKEHKTTVPDKPAIDPQLVAKQQEEAAKKAEAQRIAEAKRQAEEAAAREAARKEAAYNESKAQFGALLSGGSKGDQQSEGHQGATDGDPNSQALRGLSEGSSKVGGGLANRGIQHEPKLEDNSQKTGRVVMYVCVNAQGQVISSEFTQRGSTTVDGDLRSKAERAARQYRFTASQIEEQCGTITFDFKVE